MENNNVLLLSSLNLQLKKNLFKMDLSGIKAAFFAISWFCSSATILDVRLRDGESPNSGRVEVNVEGIGWNAVCGSSYWGLSDVIVTCRQLGFAGAQRETTRSEFGSGTAPLYTKVINCKGNENSLDECQMASSRCTGQFNAGAVCQGPSYLGCYGDNPNSRVFTGRSKVDTNSMTINNCITFCRQQNFEYAGIEFGEECYCGHAGTNYTRYGLYSDGECGHRCTGNNLETCGGIAKMAVHSTVIPTTVATTTSLSSARTPNPLERTTSSPRNTTLMTSSSSMASKVITPTGDSQQVKATLSDQTRMTIIYILGALLFFCILIIIGCLIWNRRLRSRISYNVTKEPDTPPNQGINALPYMTLSERRPDHAGGNGYQSLSVQRKEKQIDEMPEGPYAEGLGEPVYQEPEVYLVPDNVCSVSYKPGDPVTDDLFLGGSNEYETLQAM